MIKAQLSGRKRQPHEKMGDLAYDIRRAVGIGHANMALLYQEDLALDYFIQALAGTDTGALLTTFRPESLQKAADAAARWEAAKPPARGAERHALAVRQVGPWTTVHRESGLVLAPEWSWREWSGTWSTAGLWGLGHGRRLTGEHVMGHWRIP